MGIRVSAVDTLGHLSLVTTRDLGALFVLRNLINSSWQPQPATIVDGVQNFIADGHPAVGVWLSELILILRKHVSSLRRHTKGLHQMATTKSKCSCTACFCHLPDREKPGRTCRCSYQRTFAVYPALRVMPMGWQSACRLLQYCHRRLCHRPGEQGLTPGERFGATCRCHQLRALVNPTMRPGLPVLCRCLLVRTFVVIWKP